MGIFGEADFPIFVGRGGFEESVFPTPRDSREDQEEEEES